MFRVLDIYLLLCYVLVSYNYHLKTRDQYLRQKDQSKIGRCFSLKRDKLIFCEFRIFFVKLNSTLNEIQVVVTLSVSIVLLSVLLSHECRVESKGLHIYDTHTYGTWGILEIHQVFVGSTVLGACGDSEFKSVRTEVVNTLERFCLRRKGNSWSPSS